MKPKSKKSKRFEGVKFLYVDDERDNLIAFEQNYDQVFDIISETDPVKALEVFQKEPNIGVILIDQVMPKLSGLELAAQAKKIRPSVICIMITGNATKKLAMDSIKNHAFWDFLEKPVNFSSPEIHQLFIDAFQEHLLIQLKLDYHFGTVQLLSHLIDDKDGHTQRHSERVTEWAVKIATKFQLSDKEMVLVREGALLHDIGKISIPDDILKKPGRLSALERKIIMTHPARGGDLLDRVPQLKELAPIARFHHERPDGTGYPKGLKGEDIPLLASIVALADFFEALSAKRPYKDPWAIPDIVAEIARVRGEQFPNACVDALFEVIADEGLLEHEKVVEILKSVKAA